MVLNKEAGITKCPECGSELTPEERLLAAIFGETEHPLCQSCHMEGTITLRCRECNTPTQITLNGVPYCPQHIGEPH